MKLLHVDSSILGSNSISRTVTAAIVKELTGDDGSIDVVRRDLASDAPTHLSGAYLAGRDAQVQHDQALQEDLSLGGELLDEFLNAGIVVVGAPMYNFTIPSQLKAWIDRILVPGKTFRYTDNGPEGLAGDKRVIVAVSRGGIYGENAPHAALEHAETYLRTVFGFMGVKALEIVLAEGIALGPQQREKSLAAALEQASKLQAA